MATYCMSAILRNPCEHTVFLPAADLSEPGDRVCFQGAVTGSPCGEAAAVWDVVWVRSRSSAVGLFLGLRSGFAVLIFLGRPRFRPASFRPFLFSFFFRVLEGDGFLMAVVPTFSSSAPESTGVSAGTAALLSGTFVGVVVLLLFSRCCRRRAASCSSWKTSVGNVLKVPTLSGSCPPRPLVPPPEGQQALLHSCQLLCLLYR